jgi:hypothetical protein
MSLPRFSIAKNSVKTVSYLVDTLRSHLFRFCCASIVANCLIILWKYFRNYCFWGWSGTGAYHWRIETWEGWWMERRRSRHLLWRFPLEYQDWKLRSRCILYQVLRLVPSRSRFEISPCRDRAIVGFRRQPSWIMYAHLSLNVEPWNWGLIKHHAR